MTLTVTGRGVHVALEVAAGETVALLGPNGAGKSTLLGAVAGLLRPDEGRVVLGGRVLTDTGGTGRVTHVPTHDRRVALLAQEPLLFPHLTVLENVAFGPRSAGASRRRSHERARHWLAEVGVAELADRRPARISGGQAQRVAVARALAADPELLLLDEPMAALDVAVAPALRHTLRRVLADRTTVIVTHDVLDAALLADRVVVLEAGRVVESGPVVDVLARPRSAFAARIAGLNLLTGTWDGTAVRAHPGTGAGAGAGITVQGVLSDPAGPDSPVPGQQVVAVFRPSAVSVFAEHPHGSPRNALAVEVGQVEPHGDRVRVRAGVLSADITVAAATELALAPGQRVWFSVKAAEVAVHAAPTTDAGTRR